ncbi:MAG: hypothetical protein ACI9G1_001470 [Pirellulaceae bacterium]|jgi:hypothetical protein
MFENASRTIDRAAILFSLNVLFFEKKQKKTSQFYSRCQTSYAFVMWHHRVFQREYLSLLNAKLQFRFCLPPLEKVSCIFVVELRLRNSESELRDQNRI